MEKFLVISSHPDDLEFSCGGTVAKLRKDGKQVEYLIVADGSKGSHKVGFDGKKLAQLRQKEQKTAAKTLGVEKVTFLGEVDGAVENTPQLRKKLVKEIRQAKPDVVLSFDPSSLDFENVYLAHRDHRMAAEAAFDALYPAVGSGAFFPELLKEGIRPHQVKEIWFFATSRPNKWVDITATIGLKLQALFCHESQLEDAKKFEEIIRKSAAKEGKQKKIKYAECFRVIDWG